MAYLLLRLLSEADGTYIYYEEIHAYVNYIETNPNKLYYSNDGGQTWIDTGYVVVVERAE